MDRTSRTCSRVAIKYCVGGVGEVRWLVSATAKVSQVCCSSALVHEIDVRVGLMILCLLRFLHTRALTHSIAWQLDVGKPVTFGVTSTLTHTLPARALRRTCTTRK